MRANQYLILLLVLPLFPVYSQPDTTANLSKNERSFLSQQVLPLSLITVGALMNIGEFKYNIQENMPSTDTDLDDWFQYVPIGQMYLADIAGGESVNSWFDQSKYLLVSEIIMEVTVRSLKAITDVTRPDGSPHSYPSGHTTQAFVSATLLWKEYHDSAPLYALSGYGFAIATGVLRMTNNRHWLPDVVTGAGLGILIVNFVYLVEPFKGWQPFGNKSEIDIYPVAGPASAGMVIIF